MDEQWWEDFAEVCGIHAGDGWMSSYNYEVGFGTALTEKEYFHNVCALYQRVFHYGHHRIIARPKGNIIELRIPSKEIQHLLMGSGFVRGPKLDALSVPAFVWVSEERMQRFVRGLFDTDGTATWIKPIRRYHLRLSISTSSISFSGEIVALLRELGFSPTIHRWRGSDTKQGNARRTVTCIALAKDENVCRYLEDIGSSNPTKLAHALKRPEEQEEVDPPGFEPGTSTV